MSEPGVPTGEQKKQVGAVGVRQGLSHTDRTTIVPSTVPQSQIDKLAKRERDTAVLTGNKHTIVQSHPTFPSDSPQGILKSSAVGNVTEVHQQTKIPDPAKPGLHKPLIKTPRIPPIRKSA